MVDADSELRAEVGVLDLEVERLMRTLSYLTGEGIISEDDIILPGASRHLVVRTADGSIIAKSFRDRARYDAERGALAAFNSVNVDRSELYREVTGSELPYIGLPLSGREPHDSTQLEAHNLPRLTVFNPVEGDLLYAKQIAGEATVDDFVRAAVQVARLQQEGRGKRRTLDLEDILKREKPYFMERFDDIFIGQLERYADLELPQGMVDDMRGDWQLLVADSLNAAHRVLNGYYFDGNPRHHILTPEGGIVSFDFEDRIIVPSILSYASLLSFGVNKDDKPYLSAAQQTNILDRVLLEVEFADALKNRAKDRATQIFKYIGDHGDLDFTSGRRTDTFYRFLTPHNDRELGANYRNDFMAAWPFATLDRATAWIAHKARYLAVGEGLKEKRPAIKFEIPAAQLAQEQRGHLDHIVFTLDHLSQNGAPISSVRTNGDRDLRNAAGRLYNRFTEISAMPYFSPK